jgi:hypothetical protein
MNSFISIFIVADGPRCQVCDKAWSTFSARSPAITVQTCNLIDHFENITSPEFKFQKIADIKDNLSLHNINVPMLGDTAWIGFVLAGAFKIASIILISGSKDFSFLQSGLS